MKANFVDLSVSDNVTKKLSDKFFNFRFCENGDGEVILMQENYCIIKYNDALFGGNFKKFDNGFTDAKCSLLFSKDARINIRMHENRESDDFEYTYKNEDDQEFSFKSFCGIDKIISSVKRENYDEYAERMIKKFN